MREVDENSWKNFQNSPRVQNSGRCSRRNAPCRAIKCQNWQFSQYSTIETHIPNASRINDLAQFTIAILVNDFFAKEFT